ncbi:MULTISPECIES: hypothetical protein [Leucobacter]|uniref:Uncharacterized protein n=1 Tax=Leucobacter manosquensis TaxID=2810611 RepID=A0ABS5M3W2_9MICO|nr:hypothetical protein [Leucobacter manosquensis]MBS3181888.1 hypothetical protein [Leucobacter manosquensis]
MSVASASARTPYGFREDRPAPRAAGVRSGDEPDGRAPGRSIGRRFSIGDPVLDLVTVLGMIAVFALIGVLGKAVERL